MLVLEALNAEEGDCLLLHHGVADTPSHILIDGGPRATFARSLKPRLRELRELHGLDADGSLPLELLVLTHTDADHIDGLVAMLTEMSETPKHQAMPWSIEGIWYNGFDDVVNNDETAHIQSLDTGAPAAHAFVAGVQAGRKLRDMTMKLLIPVNDPFDPFAVRTDGDEPPSVDFGDDLTLTVLSPTVQDLSDLEQRWDAELEEKGVGGAAAFGDDKSPTNRASIVLLAQTEESSVLLPGDAAAGQILAGLEAAGMFEEGEPCPVDVFKIPHHGSLHNSTVELFRRVPATHYVICANGKHGNPDIETLEMLWTARGHAAKDWQIWTTFPRDAHALLTADNAEAAKRRDTLKAVQEWFDGHAVTVHYRDPDRTGIEIRLEE